MIDVFGPAGDYKGTLPPDSPFPAEFIRPDRVLVLGTDALDVPIIFCHVCFTCLWRRPCLRRFVDTLTRWTIYSPSNTFA